MELMVIAKSSIKNLLSSKLRAILTMLGIIIGIGAVIMLTSIGNGVKNSVDTIFNKIGKGILVIQVNQNLRDQFITLHESDLLTFKDLQLLKNNKNIAEISPVEMLPWSVLALKTGDPKINNEVWFNVTGIEPSYFKMQSLKILQGRFFTDQELKQNYAVIGNVLAKKVFGSPKAAVGKEITVSVNGYGINDLFKFIVLGVINNPFTSMGTMFRAKTTQCLFYIPIKNFLNITGQRYIDTYNAKIEDGTDMASVSDQIANMLASFHETVPKKYDVNPSSKKMQDFMGMLNKLNLFVGMIAAISLLVGGIGIMNIMLVIVNERTREIGIRKAIGATNKDILILFLIESVIITVIGGLIGVVCGFISASILGKFIKVAPSFHISIVIFAFIISCLIGIVFGVYPAQKAAKLNPIDALRHE